MGPVTTVTPRDHAGFRVSAIFLAPLHAVERTRGRKRALLLLLYLVIGVILATLFWRSQCLNALPDLGDPFDVSAFTNDAIPDTENAFTLYRQAIDRLGAKPVFVDTSRLGNVISGGWSKAEPEIQAWQEEHRPLLELWREASDRPKARPLAAAHWLAGPGSFSELTRMYDLGALALLEAARLEEAGDFDAAWTHFRATLRASRHLLFHAPSDPAWTGRTLAEYTLGRLRTWATNSRLSPALLRRALDDLQEVSSMTPPLSDTLRAAYIMRLRMLEHPERYVNMQDHKFAMSEYAPALFELGKFLWREPERSRRVTRLIAAHWLDYVDLPPQTRPRLVSNLVDDTGQYSDFPYSVPPGANPETHPLAAPALFQWHKSTLYDSALTHHEPYLMAAADADRRTISSLILNVAEELYRREHGKAAANAADLVSAGYLEKMPPGYEGLLETSTTTDARPSPENVPE